MRVVSEKCYARVGLMGNPSDGYGGKTLSVIVKNFFAEVTLHESAQLVIEADQSRFESVDALQAHIISDGYYGAFRLFKATIHAFARFLQCHIESGSEILTRQPNFTVSYSTNVPRLVGLAGSSALIVAMLRALMQYYRVSIDKRVLPSLALQIERDELKVGGGLQDRVVQVYEGLVTMDFSQKQMLQGFECGHYDNLNPSLLPSLYVAYSPEAKEPTEIFHNDLRQRYESGDKQVRNAMLKFASLTDKAQKALVQGNHQMFAELMNQNFDLRQSISRLNPNHINMVETARSCGASAKYAGSGGTIVGSFSGESMFSRLRVEMQAIGCEVFEPIIA